MAKTQKNKATSFHLGQLKAKLAKLKRELLTPSSGGGGGGAGFDVARTGVASIGFIGFPSVGKSTLMSRLTGQHSEAAAYEFTTLTSVPGQVTYNGTSSLLAASLRRGQAPTTPLQIKVLTHHRCSSSNHRFARYYRGSKGRSWTWSSGHCRGQDVPSHLHRAGRQQAPDRQARH